MDASPVEPTYRLSAVRAERQAARASPAFEARAAAPVARQGLDAAAGVEDPGHRVALEPGDALASCVPSTYTKRPSGGDDDPRAPARASPSVQKPSVPVRPSSPVSLTHPRERQRPRVGGAGERDDGAAHGARRRGAARQARARADSRRVRAAALTQSRGLAAGSAVRPTVTQPALPGQRADARRHLRGAPAGIESAATTEMTAVRPDMRGPPHLALRRASTQRSAGSRCNRQ